MIVVEELFRKDGRDLGLELVTGGAGIGKSIKVPEIQRPGLSLSGHVKAKKTQRLMVFGKAEIKFLRELDKKTRLERIKDVIFPECPAVIITRRLRPPQELVKICEKHQIPLFRTSIRTMMLINQLMGILNEAFSPEISCHGTLVDAFGVGVLILGDSSVGKSEAALGLIERGHRLITDDVVKIRMDETKNLMGKGPDLNRHLLEIRGIGIINVANLFGAVCVRDQMTIDMIIQLEEWDETHFYDRVGLDEKFHELLGIKVPFYVIPVKPGRDIVLLMETTVLNHRLKKMGYNSAKEFNVKLLEQIEQRRQSLETSKNR